MIYGQINFLENLMSTVSMNQKTAATNIANAQTPGYVRQPQSFETVFGKLSSPYENELSIRMGQKKPQALAQRDGRPVDLAEEFMVLQKNYLDYSVVSRHMTSVFSNLRRASQIGR